MKKNIIGVRRIFKDGDSYLYGDNSFYVGDCETEMLAMALACLEAKDIWSYDKISEVHLCWCKAEWNFEVKDDTVYKEIPISLEVINVFLDSFDIYSYLPKVNGSVLEILPDCRCFHRAFHKKLKKIRKAKRCTDWKSQNRDIEWDNASGWYLHGKLKDKVGYDIAVILNATKAGVTQDTVRWYRISGNTCKSYADKPFKQMKYNGIKRCKVIGANADCLGFFYVEEENTINYDKGTFEYWKQRGYVVQRNDTVGLLQAYHRYLMKQLD